MINNPKKGYDCASTLKDILERKQIIDKRITRPQRLWSSTTVIWPHGSVKLRAKRSSSRNRLKKRASERSSGI